MVKIKEMTTEHIFLECNAMQGKQLGATYVASSDSWRVPNNVGALRELHIMGLQVTQLGNNKAKQRYDFLEKKYGVPSLYPTFNQNLRPYQMEDASFLLQGKAFGVFNEMRTGKTPTMIQTIASIGKRTLLVVPASLILNWESEIKKWSDIRTIVVNTTPKKRLDLYQEMAMEGGVLIISKDTAKRDLQKLQELTYDVIVLDEAHYLRNYKTMQSQAIYKLGRQASHRYALTGTPATNKPSDVFGILKFLYPSRFTSYWQFVERYFTVEDGFWGKKIGEFKTKLRKREFFETLETVSIQRKRKDVMQWLPPKQYQTIPLEMGAKQRKAYDQMLDTFQVEGTEIDASTVLAQLTRLRQLSLAPSSLQVNAPSIKEEFIKEWVADNPREPVLIFSNFSTYLKTLHKDVKGSLIITGENTAKEKQQAVDDFQGGKSNVLFANIQAGGTGLTLDRAGTVIFLDRSYEPTLNAQAEDRLVATTQESNQAALIIDLVCKDSVDEKINYMVKNKISITKIVNDYRSVKEFLK